MQVNPKAIQYVEQALANDRKFNIGSNVQLTEERLALVKAIITGHNVQWEHNDDLYTALQDVYLIDCPLIEAHTREVQGQEVTQIYCGCECMVCAGLSGCDWDDFECQSGHWEGNLEGRDANAKFARALRGLAAAIDKEPRPKEE